MAEPAGLHGRRLQRRGDPGPVEPDRTGRSVGGALAGLHDDAAAGGRNCAGSAEPDGCTMKSESGQLISQVSQRKAVNQLISQLNQFD